MELDMSMEVPYKVHVKYVGYDYEGESEYQGTVTFEDIDPGEEEFYKDYLTDKYCLELDLEPDQIEVEFFIDDNIVQEKLEHLKEWEREQNKKAL